MAKRRKASPAPEMPVGVEEVAEAPQPEVVETPQVQPEEPTQTVTATITKLTVSVPSIDLGLAGYQASRVDVQNLSGKARETLKCVMRGLEETDAQLENGKICRGYSDAVKYILENLTV